MNILITEKAYNDFLSNNEKYLNKTVGNFFYSIGVISRVSQIIASMLFL